MQEYEDTIQNEDQTTSEVEPRNYGNLESDTLTKEEGAIQNPDGKTDEPEDLSEEDIKEEASSQTPVKEFKKEEVLKSPETKESKGQFLSSAIMKLPEQDTKKLYDTINSYAQNQLPMETFLSAIANKIEQLLINRKIV
jgi:hypothetical protein